MDRADRDVPELALIAQRHRAVRADLVLPHAVVHAGAGRALWPGLAACGPRDQGRASTERAMRALLVVVGAVGVELGLQVRERTRSDLAAQVALHALVQPLDLAAGLRV